MHTQDIHKRHYIVSGTFVDYTIVRSCDIVYHCEADSVADAIRQWQDYFAECDSSTFSTPVVICIEDSPEYRDQWIFHGFGYYYDGSFYSY